MAGTALSYNSFSLQSSTVITTELDDGNAPERQLGVFNLVGHGGGVIASDDWYTKTIKAKGTIQGTSVANLESLIDSFLAAMAVRDAYLDVAYGSSTRRYISTPQTPHITRGRRSMNWAEFEVDFLATDYGISTTVTTLLASSTDTTALRTVSVTVVGSAPQQLLRVQVTVTAATGLDDRIIGVANGTTNERIYLQRTWTVGDVLEVDCANNTLKVNGVLTDFVGSFPIFAPGTTNVLIDNTFTTRTLTTVIDHTRRYL